MPEKRPWKTENEETLLSSPAMNLVARQCRSTDGKNQAWTFYLLESSDWSNVIPITESGKIVLIKQYRVGIDDFTLELPGGLIDPQDGNVQEGALREMVEQTGYTLLPGATCQALGASHPNPAIMSNRVHSFIAGPVKLSREQSLDPAERIEVVETPISEIPELLRSGKISHALMMNAFFQLLLLDDGLQESLASKLSAFKTSS